MRLGRFECCRIDEDVEISWCELSTVFIQIPKLLKADSYVVVDAKSDNT